MLRKWYLLLLIIENEKKDPLRTHYLSSADWYSDISNISSLSVFLSFCLSVFLSGVSGNSRSRSFPRMEASDSLPEFREWFFSIPFPFPNFGNGFFPCPSRSRLTLSKSGIKRENGRFWEMLVFQHFQLPVHFIQDKNGGSKVKVAYVKVSNQATS